MKKLHLIAAAAALLLSGGVFVKVNHQQTRPLFASNIESLTSGGDDIWSWIAAFATAMAEEDFTTNPYAWHYYYYEEHSNRTEVRNNVKYSILEYSYVRKCEMSPQEPNCTVLNQEERVSHMIRETPI